MTSRWCSRERAKVRPADEEESWGGEDGFEPPSPGWTPGALPSLCYPRIRQEGNVQCRIGRDKSLQREPLP